MFILSPKPIHMKKFTRFQGMMAAFFAVTLLLSSCGGGGVSSPEEMGDKIVSAINGKDKAAFEGLMITKKVMGNVLDKSEMEDADRAKRKEMLEEEFSEVSEEIGKIWTKLNDDLKAAGMEGELKVDKVNKKEETRRGVVGAEVELNLSSGDKKGSLEFVAIKDGNWYLLPDLDFESETSAPMEAMPMEEQ